ncbi:hypothetical protein [Bacillus sp. 165]|uniref:hypothetical protein n=1 Tax=Bacillus sp. 165 TaxID=1529117 RepID=UPI001ADA770A|nr:hypothetical protein [Bacillus sp. 165]MBO9129100.1 hypothetical protein [Bacillus sp. 165]
MNGLKIHLFTAVPITEPELHSDYLLHTNDDFNFDCTARFTSYKHSQISSVLLTKDDHNNWYYLTSFFVSSLQEAKLKRQVMIPDYLKNQMEETWLATQMKQLGLCYNLTNFDKAITHLAVYTEELSLLSPKFQARAALIDGEDDPQIIDSFHYLSNVFNNLETRFITGVETHSFATVTENKYYFDNLHIEQNVGLLYLQYYLYFLKHDIIPSKQMMPNLLGNLWRSQQAMRNDWNPSLFQVMSLHD